MNAVHSPPAAGGPCRTAVRALGPLLVAAWLAGCANPYDIRFDPNPNLRAGDVIRGGRPTVFRLGTDPVLDSVDMRDRGFALLGQAYFDGPGRPVMEDQARNAGAAEVLVYTRYDRRDDDGPGGIGVGVGVGLRSGSIGYHTGTGYGRGDYHDHGFSDPAPGYRYLATYWALAPRSPGGSGG